MCSGVLCRIQKNKDEKHSNFWTTQDRCSLNGHNHPVMVLLRRLHVHVSSNYTSSSYYAGDPDGPQLETSPLGASQPVLVSTWFYRETHTKNTVITKYITALRCIDRPNRILIKIETYGMVSLVISEKKTKVVPVILSRGWLDARWRKIRKARQLQILNVVLDRQKKKDSRKSSKND